MKEWKYLVHFLYVFFYEHIFYELYIYIQEKFNIMKNKILWKKEQCKYHPNYIFMCIYKISSL
jgi:hypothetical protein